MPLAALALRHSPDNALWQQCWRDQDIDFHQPSTNLLLARFWQDLNLSPGGKGRIFVPLCGKSLDMLWLAAQGHRVIGVELSPIAARAFFRENRLQVRRRQVGAFTLWEHERLSILCGDYFNLTPADLGPIDAVYDRAALTALPETCRQAYVDQLRSLIPAACQVFLLTTEDAEIGETPEQSLAMSDEITELYDTAFHIELSHVEHLPDAPSAPASHKLYRLRPRA